MCRRMLDELEWNPGAISLFQSIDKTTVAIFEILVDNFQLAFQLDLLASNFPLGRGCWVDVTCVGVVRENECASEKHEAGENRTAEDPRGTDLDLHGGTFL